MGTIHISTYKKKAIQMFEKLKTDYYEQIMSNAKIDIEFHKIQLNKAGEYNETILEVILITPFQILIECFRKVFTEIRDILPDSSSIIIPTTSNASLDFPELVSIFENAPYIIQQIFHSKIGSFNKDIMYFILDIAMNMGNYTFDSLIMYMRDCSNLVSKYYNIGRVLNYVHPATSVTIYAVLNMYKTYGDTINLSVYWHYFVNCSVLGEIQSNTVVKMVEMYNVLLRGLSIKSQKIPHLYISINMTMTTIENKYNVMKDNVKQEFYYNSLSSEKQFKIIKGLGAEVPSQYYNATYVFWHTFINNIFWNRFDEYVELVDYLPAPFKKLVSSDMNIHIKYVDHIYSQLLIDRDMNQISKPDILFIMNKIKGIKK
jgi:hypothetical protein